MTTEDDFQNALDASPDDHHARLVFADWLQERGDPRAEGYRALGSLRRVPKKLNGGGWHFGWNEDDVWEQNLPRESRGFKRQAPNTLPRSWIALVESAGAGDGFALTADTRREAEDAVVRAFAELSPKRRAELLAAMPPAGKKGSTPKKPKRVARKQPVAKKPPARKPRAKKPKGKKT